ncbi:MAG: alginate export family protein [Opitutaceae bacterium]
MLPFRPAHLLLPLLVAAPCAQAAAASSPAEAVAAGAFSLQVRVRHEAVAQAGLRDAEALTARARLGFAPAPWAGWSARAEMESVAAADGDRYSQAGVNPAAAGRAVIADLDSTEINQLHFGRTFGQTRVRLGRQRLFLDNGRFVGDGSWRQNQQTFDAAVVEDRTWPGTTLTYAHLRQVNRGLGRTHPQGRSRTDSHLFHARREGLPGGTLSTYAYFLDFPEVRANGCATLGASLAGGAPMGPGMRWTYRVEAARQTDHGASPLDYAARYLAAESGVNLARGGLVAGMEVLGHDAGQPFRTPLATLHPFNGWADVFGASPAGGLRDRYLRLQADLPGALALSVRRHWFHSDRGGDRLGEEWDLLLSRQCGKAWTVLAKLADFRAAGRGLPDVRKSWLQVEYAR